MFIICMKKSPNVEKVKKHQNIFNVSTDYYILNHQTTKNTIVKIYT